MNVGLDELPMINPYNTRCSSVMCLRRRRRLQQYVPETSHRGDVEGLVLAWLDHIIVHCRGRKS